MKKGSSWKRKLKFWLLKFFTGIVPSRRLRPVALGGVVWWLSSRSLAMVMRRIASGIDEVECFSPRKTGVGCDDCFLVHLKLRESLALLFPLSAVESTVWCLWSVVLVIDLCCYIFRISDLIYVNDHCFVMHLVDIHTCCPEIVMS